MARFNDDGHHLTEFAGCVDVRCPRCSARAAVIRSEGGTSGRVVCSSCPYAISVEKKVFSGREGARPVDPFCGLELWLSVPFKNQVVWAYNLEHLRFMKEFIGADLRGRVPNRNSSLASRLPTWMKAAKNRSALLAVLADLEARADST